MTKISREEMQKLVKLVNDRMLHLKNSSVKETCPIGIIDFDKWEWPQGVGLYGMYGLYKASGDPAYQEKMIGWYEKRMAEGLPERNVNTTAPMLTLCFLAEETGRKDWKDLCRNWADWILQEMPRTEEDGLQHIVSGNENRQQLWDDTLFMAVLFLAKAGEMFDDDRYRNEAAYQFLLHAEYLTDVRTGFWFHGWSFERRDHFADALWARGNCWITVGIPEYLEIASPPEAVRKYLVHVLKTQADALKKTQADSGLWHTLLNDPSSYEEASASAGFTCGLLHAVRTGILGKEYADVAEKGMKGVIGCIEQDGTVTKVSYGTGMGSTLDDYRNIPLCPMAYGQSLTVMMLCEAMKWS
jgi:unsaturated rhamnogalacturonyl hydrolase